MKQDRLSKNNLILYASGLIPVIWFALLTAPYMGEGLVGIIENLSVAFANPFKISFCEDSLKTALIFIVMYVLGIGIYISSERNYRHREEHGSAKWGKPEVISKKYMEKKDICANKILTQNTAIGLDGRKHRRNLNILCVGGSGSGKTFHFAKVNIVNANTSFIILDPKGEILRDTGYLLEEKGYKIKILDLINMEKSDCYNPFVYIRDDNDIQRLVTNIFKNTTPKGSQAQDPFWDQAASLLLKALISILHYEAPPEDQNFSTVLDMIRQGDVSEDDEAFRSPLDRLFDDLETQKPGHIAARYYRSYRKGAGKTLKSIQITLLARLEKFDLNSLASITQARQVPSMTAWRIPFMTSSYDAALTIVLLGVRYLLAMVSFSTSFTICGIIYFPLFAMVAPRLAICSGVSVTSPWPIDMLMTVTARQ